MARIASIDLGTNTFHILIVETRENNFVEIYRERIYVNLAEDGVMFLSEKVKKRVFDAILIFKSLLDHYHVEKYVAIGTAALRKAKNGSDIIREITLKHQFEIEIISGSREAELIFKGTKLAYSFDEDSYLIMDIGGGSVEFILVEYTQMKWSKSFPIGVTLLYNLFDQKPKFTENSITAINNYFHEELKELVSTLKNVNVKYLIGASGSFDVLESLLDIKPNDDNCVLLYPNKDYKNVYQQVVFSSSEQRNEMKAIPKSRAQLIPIALLLIDFVLNICKPNAIMVSPYAMKEGMISEMM